MPTRSYDDVKSVLNKLHRSISDARRRRLGEGERPKPAQGSVAADAWIGGSKDEATSDTNTAAPHPLQNPAARPAQKAETDTTPVDPSGTWAAPKRSSFGRAKPLSGDAQPTNNPAPTPSDHPAANPNANDAAESGDWVG